MRYCLDSWAVLAWLQGEEPAARIVQRAISSRPVMSWINAGEVFYIVARSAGEQAASEAVRDLRRVVDLETPDDRRVLEAAAIKAVHTMAYADAFAVATAAAHDLTLLTGDPEILSARGDWRVRDLRG